MALLRRNAPFQRVEINAPHRLRPAAFDNGQALLQERRETRPCCTKALLDAARAPLLGACGSGRVRRTSVALRRAARPRRQRWRDASIRRARSISSGRRNAGAMWRVARCCRPCRRRRLASDGSDVTSSASCGSASAAGRVVAIVLQVSKSSRATMKSVAVMTSVPACVRAGISSITRAPFATAT